MLLLPPDDVEDFEGASWTTWNVSSGEEVDPSSGLKEAPHLTFVAVQRVWEELSKHEAVRRGGVQDQSGLQHAPPDVKTHKDIVMEPSLKLCSNK